LLTSNLSVDTLMYTTKPHNYSVRMCSKGCTRQPTRVTHVTFTLVSLNPNV